jgi:cobalamin biosynthesis protein CobW
MASLVVRRSGRWERSDLEQRLRQLLNREPILRLKGRLVQAERPLPLQIQAVGPRLECWYEGEVSGDQAQESLELVVIAAQVDRDRLAAAFETL